MVHCNRKKKKILFSKFHTQFPHSRYSIAPLQPHQFLSFLSLCFVVMMIYIYIYIYWNCWNCRNSLSSHSKRNQAFDYQSKTLSNWSRSFTSSTRRFRASPHRFWQTIQYLSLSLAINFLLASVCFPRKLHK